MAGRRLLDAAAIFKASKAVAAKHVRLRTHQLEAYNKTSSLTKALKNQTDRFTTTAKAASVLADRFVEPRLQSSTAAQKSNLPRESVPSKNSVAGNSEITGGKEGLEQDHFYERSVGNTTAEPLPNAQLDVAQEKTRRDPLPDGTIPPVGADIDLLERDKDVVSETPRTESAKEPIADDQRIDNDIQPVSSGRSSIPRTSGKSIVPPADQARKLQRQAESQIPSQSAEPPPATAPSPQVADRSNAEGTKSGVDDKGDVFYTPSRTISPAFSSLPRVKVPKVTADTQSGDKNVQDGEINQDVFYSSTQRKEEEHIPRTQAVPDQKQPTDDIYSEIFHSPRVAEMLGTQSKQNKTTYKSGLYVAQEKPVQQTKLSQDKDQDSFNVRTSSQEDLNPEQPSTASASETSKESMNEDIQDLAADIAKDAQAIPPAPSEVSFQHHYLTRSIC